ncbi:hypothetical protein [Pontibacter liquoris]|uniref:hypothetical protein n=1 Tax=Pontibacter liquoris TaxID=2905677 RepID=UPI001FA6CFB0|nr:hypothetical protein [Pontibacter liquoris]
MNEQRPFIESKELKKANGYVFYEARSVPGGSYININWIGLQSLETVMMGCNQTLAILRETPCTGLLNSNRELIGPWEIAVNWLVKKWVPQAKALGLRYYAHVQAPGIYGKRSFAKFHGLVQKDFEIKEFDDEETAAAWLLEKTSEREEQLQ